VSPLELVDDRFEQLARELREARPAASEDLRERIRVLTQAEPIERRERFRPRIAWGRSAKRASLALAAVAVAVPLAGAGVQALRGSHTTKPVVSGGPLQAQRGSPKTPQPFSLEQNTTRQDKGSLRSLGPAAAPNLARLQQYGATLRLRVDDVDALSNATKRALRVTRELGGYVAAVGYTTYSGQRGGAELVLRVPIGNVQTAIERFSALGTILGQQVSVLDVQRRSDRQAKAIARLETDLARIEALLATSLPSATRIQLEHEATADRLALKTLQRKHKALLRRAYFTRIELKLTTSKPKPAASGRLDRTLDDAGSVLVRELEILLYALVVVGPLLVIGAAGIAAGRVQRRRSDRRLLERA
jgi:hypothetical protein